MAKICVQCGKDCTDSKRFKDSRGNYTCLRCYDRMKYGLPIEKDAAADQGLPIALADEEPIVQGDPVPCPRCRNPVPAGETFCRKCQYDSAIGAASRTPAMEVSRPCSKCGYDLKGLPPRSRCPECGADEYTREQARKAGR